MRSELFYVPHVEHNLKAKKESIFYKNVSFPIFTHLNWNIKVYREFAIPTSYRCTEQNWQLRPLLRKIVEHVEVVKNIFEKT